MSRQLHNDSQTSVAWVTTVIISTDKHNAFLRNQVIVTFQLYLTLRNNRQRKRLALHINIFFRLSAADEVKASIDI